METEIIEVTKDNIDTYSPKCFIAIDNIGMIKKAEWVKKRFKEGLKIKQIYEKGKLIGFIEYIDGKNAFRAVDATDHLFIHCLWISPNKYKNQGLGTKLLQEVEKDVNYKIGIAVITSDDSFMANKNLFEKNGYKEIETKEKFQLMVKQIKKGELPKLKDNSNQLKNYQGLNIIYSSQCPWVAKSIDEIVEISKSFGLSIKVKEILTPKEAQLAPSIYSTFNLIYNGKILADRYISNTRFKNILKKEILK